MITPVEGIPDRAPGRPQVYDTSAIKEFVDSGYKFAYYDLPQGCTESTAKKIRTAFDMKGKRHGVKIHKRGPRLYMERV